MASEEARRCPVNSKITAGVLCWEAMHLVLFMDDTGNSEDEVHLVSSSSSGKYYGNHSLDDNVPADEDCVDAVVHSRK